MIRKQISSLELRITIPKRNNFSDTKAPNNYAIKPSHPQLKNAPQSFKKSQPVPNHFNTDRVIKPNKKVPFFPFT